MKLNFGLHLKIEFTTIKGFEDISKTVRSEPSKYIWLQGPHEKIRAHIPEINKLTEQIDLQIITEHESLIEEGLLVAGLICADFKKIQEKKKKYDSIKIGGTANDVAAAKNIEIFSGDFVYLGPINEVGTMPYITLIPKEPDYEWRFIDITIPVISFGSINSQDLESLTKKVNLSGFASSTHDFKKHAQYTYRFVGI